MSSNTVNTIQKMTPDGTHIGDSRITDDGTTITLGTPNEVFITVDPSLFQVQMDAFSNGSPSALANVVCYAPDAASATVQLFVETNSADDTSVTVTDGKVDIVAADGIAQSAPASTTAAILANGQISMWLDQSGNKLKFAVKYSDGTTKSAELALT